MHYKCTTEKILLVLQV